jgi:hypothetical protein
MSGLEIFYLVFFIGAALFTGIYLIRDMANFNR